MDTDDRGWLLWPLLCSLKREARSVRLMPEKAVAVAVRAASDRFADLAHVRMDNATTRRVAAYFWGTARRAALRSDRAYAHRVVRATLAADLAAAGWEPRAIDTELERAGLSA